MEAAPVRVLAWDHAVAKRKLALGVGERSSLIEGMHPAQRAKAIKVPADSSNVRLMDMERKGEDGKQLAIPLTIPASMKYPLVLLIPNEKSPIGLEALIMDDNPADFRWGSFNLLNATRKPLAARFYGKKLLPLRATKKPVNYAPPKGSGAGMQVELFDPTGKTKRPIYSEVWEYEEDLRLLAILVPRKKPDTRGPLLVKFIPERRSELITEERP